MPGQIPVVELTLVLFGIVLAASWAFSRRHRRNGGYHIEFPPDHGGYHIEFPPDHSGYAIELRPETLRAAAAPDGIDCSGCRLFAGSRGREGDRCARNPAQARDGTILAEECHWQCCGVGKPTE